MWSVFIIYYIISGRATNDNYMPVILYCTFFSLFFSVNIKSNTTHGRGSKRTSVLFIRWNVLFLKGENPTPSYLWSMTYVKYHVLICLTWLWSSVQPSEHDEPFKITAFFSQRAHTQWGADIYKKNRKVVWQKVRHNGDKSFRLRTSPH